MQSCEHNPHSIFCGLSIRFSPKYKVFNHFIFGTATRKLLLSCFIVGITFIAQDWMLFAALTHRKKLILYKAFAHAEGVGERNNGEKTQDQR